MYKRYGILGLVRLSISLIYTKLVFPKARLIRLPFDIRNKRYIVIGKGFTTGFGCRIEAHPENDKKQKCIIIGENVEINDFVHIASGEKVVIGNNVLIASKVFISDIDHGSYSGDAQDSPLTFPNARKLSTKPVIIEDNVWIGESVSIISGVTIGKGVVVGANSVVTKSIPSFSIAVGVPAKIVKTFDFNTQKWVPIPKDLLCPKAQK